MRISNCSLTRLRTSELANMICSLKDGVADSPGNRCVLQKLRPAPPNGSSGDRDAAGERSGEFGRIILLTNTSGTPLAMVVNYGLQAQNECNCVVQSGAGATKIGYYLYYSNSNMAAFCDGTNYTGMYRIFNGLGSFVQANSGVTNLTVSVFP